MARATYSKVYSKERMEENGINKICESFTYTSGHFSVSTLHSFEGRLFFFLKAEIKSILSSLRCYFGNIIVNIRQENVHIGKMIKSKQDQNDQ